MDSFTRGIPRLLIMAGCFAYVVGAKEAGLYALAVAGVLLLSLIETTVWHNRQ